MVKMIKYCIWGFSSIMQFIFLSNPKTSSVNILVCGIFAFICWATSFMFTFCNFLNAIWKTIVYCCLKFSLLVGLIAFIYYNLTVL